MLYPDVQRALAEMRRILAVGGIKPEEYPLATDHVNQKRHAVWMCDTALSWSGRQSEVEKAMRWLGFVQGWAWSAGLVSVGQLRDMNRSEGDPWHERAGA